MSIMRMREVFSSGRLLKWVMYGIAAIFFVGCFTMYGSNMFGGRDNGSQRGGDVVAKVNGQPITYQEFNSMLEQQEKQQEQMMGQPLGVSQKAMMEGQVLDQFIDRYIRLQAAKTERLDVSKSAINDEIDKIYKQQVETLKSQLFANPKLAKKATDEDVNKELSKIQSEMAPKSLDDLRNKLDTKEMRSAIEADLLMKALDKKVEGGVKPMTDAQLIDTFKEVKASHILIKTGQGGLPDEQAKRKAEEVLKMARGGEDFAKLAKQYSGDPGSKDRGGDLGWNTKGRMVPEFDKVMFELKPGQISNVVKTDFGYHIIKVEGSRVNLPKDFEKNKKKLRDDAMAQARQKSQSDYYGDLKKKAKIEITDPFLQGIHYLMLGMDAKNQSLAVASFNKAIKANAEDVRPQVMLAQLYMQRGDTDKARKTLEQILDVKHMTEDAELRMMLGRIYQEKKENAKAVDQYKIASDMSYNNIQIHYQLQEAFKQLGRPDLAAKETQQVQDYMKQMQAQQQAMQPKPEPAKPAAKK